MRGKVCSGVCVFTSEHQSKGPNTQGLLSRDFDRKPLRDEKSWDIFNDLNFSDSADRSC